MYKYSNTFRVESCYPQKEIVNLFNITLVGFKQIKFDELRPKQYSKREIHFRLCEAVIFELKLHARHKMRMCELTSSLGIAVILV